MIELHNPKTGAYKRCEIEDCKKSYAVILVGKKYIKAPYDNIKWVSNDWHFKRKKKLDLGEKV